MIFVSKKTSRYEMSVIQF